MDTLGGPGSSDSEHWKSDQRGKCLSKSGGKFEAMIRVTRLVAPGVPRNPESVAPSGGGGSSPQGEEGCWLKEKKLGTGTW